MARWLSALERALRPLPRSSRPPASQRREARSSERTFGERTAELGASLIPFAVDAALLGADGLSELARVVAASAELLREPSSSRLSTSSIEQQRRSSIGDASGARTDESRLLELAEGLRRDGAPHSRAEPCAAEAPPSPRRGTRRRSESVWAPDLPEDMLGAFLDECVERTGSSVRAPARARAARRGARARRRDLPRSRTLEGLERLRGSREDEPRRSPRRGPGRRAPRGKRQLDRPLVSVLLETLDVLRAILARARERRPIDANVSPLLTRLSDPALSEGPGRGWRPPKRRAPRSSPRSRARGALRARCASSSRRSIGSSTSWVRSCSRAAGSTAPRSSRKACSTRSRSSRKRVLVPGERAEESLADELERTERVLRDNFRDLDAGLGGLGLAVGQLRDTVMKLRMVPIARLFGKYQRTVRELSHRLGKEVTRWSSGAETELDKVLVERLEDPMLHLVRNAVDRRIETPDARRAAGKPLAGRLLLDASQRGGQIFVRVSDDGRGLDATRLKAKAVERGLFERERSVRLERARRVRAHLSSRLLDRGPSLRRLGPRRGDGRRQVDHRRPERHRRDPLGARSGHDLRARAPADARHLAGPDRARGRRSRRHPARRGGTTPRISLPASSRPWPRAPVYARATSSYPRSTSRRRSA